MLVSVHDILGHIAKGVDGELGTITDFYFDDAVWNIRYLVLDVSGRLPAKRILLSPAALTETDWDNKTLTVNLSKEKIAGCPPVDEAVPVSRQYEMELARYYEWRTYWNNDAQDFDTAIEPVTSKPTPETTEAHADMEKANLRSSAEVIDYHIQARDEKFGHIEDFIVDTDTWNIKFLVVDTREWLPGKKVRLSPQSIASVSWLDKIITVDKPGDEIRSAPAYDAKAPIVVQEKIHIYDFEDEPKEK